MTNRERRELQSRLQSAIEKMARSKIEFRWRDLQPCFKLLPAGLSPKAKAMTVAHARKNLMEMGIIERTGWGRYRLSDGDAIDDLGVDRPATTATTVQRYARDPGVRSAVIRRAKGKCELCCKLGFKRPDGSRYLEAHHIIALAADGEDRMTNVIALCPDDHRKAHFGRRHRELEKKMIRKVNAA